MFRSSYYGSFDPNSLSWSPNENDIMILDIKYNGVTVMKISVHEVIESAGYNNIMDHVRVCNQTPWLHKWQEERMQDVFSTLVGTKNEHS